MRLDASRRRFIATAGALSAGALFPTLAAWTGAAAQSAADYRALVCVFLYGGNDGNNTVVPYDDYASYAAGRGQGTGGALDVSTLVPITPKGIGRRYGLHPNLAPLAPLFAQGKLAIVCNVGTLVAPLTQAQYQAGLATPQNLFSHSDQQLAWQGLIPGAVQNSGFGGRIVDAISAGNPALAIPGMVSLAGDALYTVGLTTLPVSLSGDGSTGLPFDASSTEGQILSASLGRLLTVERGNQLVARAADVMALALQSTAALSAVQNAAYPAIDAAFQNVNSDLAAQLQQVAALIAGRGALGVQRQCFFCSMGGYDTHSDQLQVQGSCLNDLGAALAAFYSATDALGVAAQVTTFTLSDFSRTFRINANAGSDHAWGGHHLVLGGAVAGGDFFGRFPNLAMGGPDDSGSDGVWIPTTAIDQYGATLAAWLGVPSASLTTVFPNLGRFSPATLAFLG